jgi:RNA polymerase sigma factor (sigma-70 family)
MSPDEIYLQNLRSIERIAGFVARKHFLSAEDASEFIQEVRVRLLDDDYSIIRKFQGKSSFTTYLTTVILRLYHQWRVEQWGKWRPSAEAKRLGDKAITLERLISRDGFSYQEAVRVLTTPAGSQFTPTELESIYRRLPNRTPRPVSVPDELLPELAVAESGSDDRVEAEERARTAHQAETAIDGLFEQLDAEDRLILQMRFWDSRKVPEIARTLHIEQKKIYKRLDKLFGVLRRGLEQAGISKSAVAELLTYGDQEMTVGITPPGPSNGRGGEARGGEGRPR